MGCRGLPNCRRLDCHVYLRCEVFFFFFPLGFNIFLWLLNNLLQPYYLYCYLCSSLKADLSIILIRRFTNRSLPSPPSTKKSRSTSLSVNEFPVCIFFYCLDLRFYFCVHLVFRWPSTMHPLNPSNCLQGHTSHAMPSVNFFWLTKSTFSINGWTGILIFLKKIKNLHVYLWFTRRVSSVQNFHNESDPEWKWKHEWKLQTNIMKRNWWVSLANGLSLALGSSIICLQPSYYQVQTKKLDKFTHRSI